MNEEFRDEPIVRNPYLHNFNRMKQHLNAIVSSSDEPFKTVEEANYYREKVKEAANAALCYIPEAR